VQLVGKPVVAGAGDVVELGPHAAVVNGESSWIVSTARSCMRA
jgi:hypothetical protein